ncbi:MAG: hypothetical protein EOO68_14175, partial [Moraxellaceae bacterium]
YDAIVNPANQSLLAGSGLCGKIHALAGPLLETVCKAHGRQQIGAAIATPAFNLQNCQFIVHACGPRWLDGNHDERMLLGLTYENIFNAVAKMNISSIAIPAISTGIYRFPIEDAAYVAAVSCAKYVQHDLAVYFVIPEREKFAFFNSVLSKCNQRA